MRHHYRTVALAKTGTLFRFACQLGADLSRCDTNERSALLEYADHLALAFQIVDDIRDIEGAADLGKAAGTDAAGHVLSWPVIEWLAESSEACDQWDELGRSRQGPAPHLAAVCGDRTVRGHGPSPNRGNPPDADGGGRPSAVRPFRGGDTPRGAVRVRGRGLAERTARAAGGRPSAGRAAPATANGATAADPVAGRVRNEGARASSTQPRRGDRLVAVCPGVEARAAFLACRTLDVFEDSCGDSALQVEGIVAAGEYLAGRIFDGAADRRACHRARLRPGRPRSRRADPRRVRQLIVSLEPTARRQVESLVADVASRDGHAPPGAAEPAGLRR